MKSVSGSKDGYQAFALFDDGALWRFAHNRGEGAWNKTALNLLGVDKILCSPDAARILAITKKQSSVYDLATGAVLLNLDAVHSANWSQSEANSLVVCKTDGTVELYVDDKCVGSKPLERPQGASVESVHFFKEAWSDPDRPARDHVLIHASTDESGFVGFVSLESLKENLIDPKIENWTPIPANCFVANSPTEGIFVTGTESGAVRVWNASPSWESIARPLFELEGHLGSKIAYLTFSADGKTIISADMSNRLFAWPSISPR